MPETNCFSLHIGLKFTSAYYILQALTSGFLYKLAQLEEGRRYLNYSSKISNDIKKVLRKKAPFLEYDTVESLNATLNLLNPPLAQNCTSVAYYCKSIDEGKQKKFLNWPESEYRPQTTHSFNQCKSDEFRSQSFQAGGCDEYTSV